ncbi:MAG: phytoene/squalene synthase family protein [Lysobacter sp.]
MSEPVNPLDAERPADARDDGSAALADFTGKWQARWPEWRIAEVFVAADQRATALAWATLQQELVEAAWGGSDPRPGVAKLGWWQEELSGWARGARRHPIGTVLQPHAAPWPSLAAALPALADSRERPASVDDAFAAIHSFATAVADIDRALLGSDGDLSDPLLVAACLLQSRMVHGGDAHVPLDMLARAGSGDAVATWAAQLEQRWPREPAGIRVRRLWAALAYRRLRVRPLSTPLPLWQVLWVSWRAARD